MFDSATFSYLIAALILGGGMLAASLCRAPDRPAPVAQKQNASSSPAPFVPEPNMTCVGKITSTSNVKWADPRNAMKDLARGKIAIAAGLMELAYDSGTKVILQGPAEYFVDSPNSGALNFGKVTVCAVGKQEGSGAGAPGSGSKERPSSFVPHPPSPSYFSIRTPPIIVSERSGEFGLSVERSRTCLVHTFRGQVEWRYVAAESSKWESLQKGRYVWITADADDMLTATYFWPTPTKPTQIFARQLPKDAPVYTGNGKIGVPGT